MKSQIEYVIFWLTVAGVATIASMTLALILRTIGGGQ